MVGDRVGGGQAGCSRGIRRGGAPALLIALVAAGVSCSRPEGIVVDLVAERGRGRLVRATALEDFAGSSPGSQLLDGWGNREVEYGTMDDFRWATGPLATVAFWILPSDAHRVSFRAWPFFWSQAPPQTVTVAVNDATVAELVLADDVKTYSIPVPPGALVPGRNVLAFSFSRVDIPRERVPGSGDARSLAAAFLWIELSQRNYAADSLRPEGADSEIGSATTNQLAIGAGEGFAFQCRLPSSYPRLRLAGLSAGEEDLEFGLWVRGERHAPRLLELGRLRADKPTEVDLSFAAGQKVELVLLTEHTREAPPSSSSDGGAAAVVAELIAPDSEVRAANSHVVVDFEPEDQQTLFHSGWSPPEREPNSAESFAWVVGRSAELRLWLLPDAPQWLSVRAVRPAGSAAATPCRLSQRGEDC